MFSTHSHGHIPLTYSFVSSMMIIVGQPWSYEYLLSDHIPVMCHLTTCKPLLADKIVPYRKYSHNNTSRIFTESMLCQNVHVPGDISELASL